MVGKVALRAVFAGVVAGVAYGLMLYLRAPLCPPTAVDCAAEAGGALFAVQLGGVATALALPVLAVRAGLGWAVAAAGTTAVLALNVAWFLATSSGPALSGMWTLPG